MHKKLKLLLFVYLIFNCFLSDGRVSAAETVLPGNADKIAGIEEDNGLTPFQFLCMTTANSEYISFGYKHIRNSKESDECSISRNGENIVAVFPATRKDGSKISVRQLEVAEKVYYILDSEKKVFEYRGPAQDILLNKMQNVVKNAPEKVYKKDEAVVYEYQQAFEQDDQIKISWQFYMKDNRLIKLETCFDGKQDAVYEFSEFSQDEPAGELFMIPEGYEKNTFDYSYAGDTMPPWFE